MKRLTNIFVFLFVFVFNTVHGQTKNGKDKNSVYGKLLYKDGSPKSNTLIFLSNLKNQIQKSQFTDSVGGFAFSDIKAGDYFIGLTDGKNKIIKLKAITLNDSLGSINTGEIIVDKEIIILNEVVVNSSRPYIQRKLDKLIVNVDANTMLAGNTLNELLPKLPSISLNEHNELVINGKSNVLILIDGKGQYVNKDQLTTVLDNIKAESIDKIEIISNPSVKYDANGGVVINVITKKNKSSSDVHTSFGQQLSPVANVSGKNEPNYAVGTDLNYLIGKVKTFASIDYTYRKDFQEINNTLQYLSPILNRDGLTIANSKSSTLSTRFGFNTDLNKTTSFDGTFSLYIPLERETNRVYTQTFTSTSNAVDSLIKSSGQENLNQNRNNTVNLRLSKQINERKNEEIAFYFDYSDFNYEDNSSLLSNFYIENDNYKNELYNSFHLYSVKIYSFKSDYSIKVGKKSQLEAGGKISFIHNVDDGQYSYLQNEANLSDATQFTYKEVVSAGYLNFVGTNSFIDYQIGGRLENTSSVGIASEGQERVSRQYLNFFPAFTVQHNFKGKTRQQLGLSFNRRIVRPGYSDFNPNNNAFFSRFGSTTGDPNLNSQFINNFELSYNRASLNITVYDAYETNIKAIIPQASNQGLVQENKTLSFSSANDLGLNISWPLTVTRWWSWYTSFNGGYSSQELLDNTTIHYFSYFFSEAQSFSVNSRNKIDVRIFYRPETQIAYGKQHETTNLSAGYRVTFLENKLSLAFNVNDILGQNKLSYYQNFGTVFSALRPLRNDRYYRLTFRYNFDTGNKFSLRNKKTKNDNSEIRY